MIGVIIAGGSGTRLWPLSTPNYPKHLLKVNGSSKSLLQNTYDRAKQVCDDIYVITESGHAHHVREQLPDLDEAKCIIEPARRGTTGCFLAAFVKIASNAKDHTEPIAFMHADHYVRDTDGFAHSLNVAANAARTADRIVLIGIEPDYPATGFGYIQKQDVFDEKSFVFNVHTFKEKPDYQTAKNFINSGKYLWNAGYFVGSLSTFVNSMQRFAKPMSENYQKLLGANTDEEFEKIYLELESDAIDYSLSEHVPDLLVVPASFDWMDMGSYGDLHKAVDSDEAGNHTHGNKVELEGVQNSFVQNHEDKPVAVVGLDNVVVVNTKDGILVARKDQAQKIGEVSKRFQEKK